MSLSVLSIFALIEDGIEAAAALWPNASRLQHAALVTTATGGVIAAETTAVAQAQGQNAPTIDPSVALLSTALPSLVQSIVDLKNQLQGAVSAAEAAKAPVISNSNPTGSGTNTPPAPAAPVPVPAAPKP